MAKVEIQDYDGPDSGYVQQIKVTLSRRNLLALLHKLDMEGSGRRIENNVVKIDGQLEDAIMLVLCCENDAEHYADPDRGGIAGLAGRMHPDTETFIREKTHVARPSDL